MATAPMKPATPAAATPAADVHGLALVAHVEAQLAFAEAREAATDR